MLNGKAYCWTTFMPQACLSTFEVHTIDMGTMSDRVLDQSRSLFHLVPQRAWAVGREWPQCPQRPKWVTPWLRPPSSMISLSQNHMKMLCWTFASGVFQLLCKVWPPDSWLRRWMRLMPCWACPLQLRFLKSRKPTRLAGPNCEEWLKDNHNAWRASVGFQYVEFIVWVVIEFSQSPASHCLTALLQNEREAAELRQKSDKGVDAKKFQASTRSASLVDCKEHLAQSFICNIRFLEVSTEEACRVYHGIPPMSFATEFPMSCLTAFSALTLAEIGRQEIQTAYLTISQHLEWGGVNIKNLSMRTWIAIQTLLCWYNAVWKLSNFWEGFCRILTNELLSSEKSIHGNKKQYDRIRSPKITCA